MKDKETPEQFKNRLAKQRAIILAREESKFMKELRKKQELEEQSKKESYWKDNL